MTQTGKQRRRSLMHMSLKCLPKRIPLDRSVLMLLAMDQWPNYAGACVVIMVLSWVVWLFYEIFGQPVDIFEHYRYMPTLDDTL